MSVLDPVSVLGPVSVLDPRSVLYPVSVLSTVPVLDPVSVLYPVPALSAQGLRHRGSFCTSPSSVFVIVFCLMLLHEWFPLLIKLPY